MTTDSKQSTVTRDRNKLIELLTSEEKKDLHIHTCYSDGVLTPAEVTDRWISDGYRIIAITDHDGIEGSEIGMKYAKNKDVTFISGIEFDSEDDLGRELHILGYGFDYSSPVLRSALYEIIMNRARRNDAMMAALNRMGYGITLDDIGSVNEGRYVGKPTFALILSRKGFIGSPQEAFNTVFRDPSIRAVRKITLKTSEVVKLIHEAGGLAVLAHPMEQRRFNESFGEFRPRLYAILDRMVTYGIDGIECWHPSASEMQSELLSAYADQHGLIKTRGSDFHSDDHPRDFSRYHSM